MKSSECVHVSVARVPPLSPPQRMDCHHRLMQFLFDSKHYVREVLATKRPHKRRILDLGTGSGLWCVTIPCETALQPTVVPRRAIEMADEFPDVEVTGVDLAPIQPL
jgi:methylase of polypeptide subunit release factors